jgi:hypothetical protein
MKKTAAQAGRRGAQPPAAASPAANRRPDPAISRDEPAPARCEDRRRDDDEGRLRQPAQPDHTLASASRDRAHAGAAEERERVLAIQALGRPGEEAIVASCVADPDCTPAMAALKLRQAEGGASTANHLAALRGDETAVPAPSRCAARRSQTRSTRPRTPSSTPGSPANRAQR